MSNTEVGLGLDEDVILADQGHFKVVVGCDVVLLSELNKGSSVDATCNR
jgi:hypothetical protein